MSIKKNEGELMNFYLSNEHRKYMGLKLVMPNYDLVKIKKNEFEEFYLFFNENKIVKLISYNISNNYIQMVERDVNYETAENRSIVLPKTARGSKKLEMKHYLIMCYIQ